MGQLRQLKKKIKPATKFDVNEEGEHVLADELAGGEIGKGILSRKYIATLDMDFYAGRSSIGKQETQAKTTKFPTDLLKDVGSIVESKRTRFKDSSEVIRTAVYIFINYLADHVEKGIKESCVLRDIEDMNRVETNERNKLRRVCEGFEKLFEEKKKDGDYELGKFIAERVEKAKLHTREFYRYKMLKAFYRTIEENEIDPDTYINKEEFGESKNGFHSKRSNKNEKKYD